MPQRPVFSVDRDGERWRVLVDGEALLTTAHPRQALSTAIDAVDILRRAGLSADLNSPSLVWDAPHGPRRR